MKTLNYWQHFIETGNPEDYLFYKEKERELEERAAGRAEAYAGSGKFDRNCIENGAYRGLR